MPQELTRASAQGYPARRGVSKTYHGWIWFNSLKPADFEALNTTRAARRPQRKVPGSA
ncbi:hypothetical protein BQ8794_60099 [Mesorhizobium prunaredense]|uniref:Uncharacterized protein n=1 Tax=Mesorhizobium prunaredense TaxID=1631249 RepID=A0A1R3VFV2_9HYPH|nr:hypothetical protein BQ8794_60099 [Mesorhizobium prunaredense]